MLLSLPTADPFNDSCPLTRDCSCRIFGSSSNSASKGTRTWEEVIRSTYRCDSCSTVVHGGYTYGHIKQTARERIHHSLRLIRSSGQSISMHIVLMLLHLRSESDQPPILLHLLLEHRVLFRCPPPAISKLLQLIPDCLINLDRFDQDYCYPRGEGGERCVKIQ